MDWSREDCLRLIDLYKNQPALWDPHNDHYYSRIYKQNSWLTIANDFGYPVDDVKKKMESLLGSFRREKARIRKFCARKGSKKLLSKWYAFKKLNFLMYKNVMPYEEVEESSVECNNFNDESQKRNNHQTIVELIPHQNDYTSDKVNNMNKFIPKKKMKREKQHDEDDNTQCIRRMSVEQEQNYHHYIVSPHNQQEQPSHHHHHQQQCQLRQRNDEKDEYDIYGEYVAFKLRNMSSNGRIFTQKAINDVLFKADLGKYENHPNVVVVDYNEDGDLCETTANAENLLETLSASL